MTIDNNVPFCKDSKQCVHTKAFEENKKEIFAASSNSKIRKKDEKTLLKELLLLDGITFICENQTILGIINDFLSSTPIATFNCLKSGTKKLKVKNNKGLFIANLSSEARKKALIDYCSQQNLIFCDVEQAERMLTNENPNDSNIVDCFRSDVLRTLLFIVGSNGNVIEYKDDLRLMGVPHCINVNFNQFIGETTRNEYGIISSEQVFDTISHYKKILIKANAGTGKGYIMRELVRRLEQIKEAEFVLYVFPTNSITDQQYNDFCNSIDSEKVLKLDSNATLKDIEEFVNFGGNIIISTFDSIKKVEKLSGYGNLIDRSILVVDEYHSLISDIDFRDKVAFHLCLSYMSRAVKTIICSATPELIFCESEKIHRHFGYKLISGIEKVTNKIEVSSLVYKSKEGQKSIVSYIQEKYARISGTVLFKLDKKESLRSIIYGFKALGKTIDGFWSGDNEEHKGKNENYKEVTRTGLLKNNVEWLAFTTLLEAGVSLKFACSCLVIADSTNATRLIQLSTRARYNAKTGINKSLKVLLCQSDAKKEGVKGYKTGNYVNNFIKEVAKWQRYKNNTPVGRKSVRTGSDQDYIKLILGDENEAEISILGLLHVINKELDSVSTDELLLRVTRLDNRFSVGAVIKSDCDQLPQIKSATEKTKKDKELREQNAINAAKDDFRTMCDLISFKSRSTERKNEIREILGIAIPNKEKALEFAEKHPTVIDCKFTNKIIDSVVRLKTAAKASSKNLTNQNALKMVLELSSKDLKGITSTLNHKTRRANVKNNDAATVDTLEYYKVRCIRKVVSKYMANVTAGRIKDFQTVDYHQKHINKAIAKLDTNLGTMKLKPINKNKVNVILEDIYETIKTRFTIKGKKVMMIKILGKRTVESAMQAITI